MRGGLGIGERANERNGYLNRNLFGARVRVVYHDGSYRLWEWHEAKTAFVPLALESQMKAARWRAERPRERKSPGKTTLVRRSEVADAAITQPAQIDGVEVGPAIGIPPN